MTGHLNKSGMLVKNPVGDQALLWEQTASKRPQLVFEDGLPVQKDSGLY